MKRVFGLLLITAVIFACNNDNTGTSGQEEDTSVVMQSAPLSDSTPVPDEVAIQQELAEEHMKENATNITYSSGLTFCDCVKKQKALNDKLMEAEEDSEIKKLQEEMKALMNGECKEFLATNQTTKEDQEAHQRKVKKCLGN